LKEKQNEMITNAKIKISKYDQKLQMAIEKIKSLERDK
jgi:uncharacterized coiled-coil protein SlyX